ncbi:hypothetical protein ABE42_36900 [Bacillus thuringiensis]|uniref:DUF4359 domain-containing protein n=1 Tax=Bacillus thuringiensis TaxID=1428 RepID=A0A437SBD8_BACTU|nr:DUF4359 domain-containing protein [Bacillus thuringiensis]MBG9539885.1 hypothetical protein [Bacillus thuringiensis]MBG9584642.1 hypothetical protein [Bacillus thuringiensis]RVU60709.1 hypothetical protein BM74_30005 [Bacillus thuringiensis]
MKKKYIVIAPIIFLFVYLVYSNPSKGEYTNWAAKQFMEFNDVSKKLKEVEEENQESLLSDLILSGKKLAEKYIEPQAELVIHHHTKRDNYILFSTYTTEFDFGEEHYKYVCVGFSKTFIHLEMQKEENKSVK